MRRQYVDDMRWLLRVVGVVVTACLLPVVGQWIGALQAGVPSAAGAGKEAVIPGHDHDCIVGRPPPSIDWAALRNPILSYPANGVKDQALQRSGGSWHMLFSELSSTHTAPHVHWDVAIAHSRDLRHWSEPTVIATNAASPDIVRDPAGRFVVTYQTTSGQLEYRISTSSALSVWSPAHPLAHGLAGRMIDAALAFTGHGVVLGFKAGTTAQHQHFEIAWAPSLSGRFRLVGQPDIVVYADTIENYEFLTVDGGWHLVATSNILDQPYLFSLGPGDPSVPTTWLHWSPGTQLMVPNEAFNSGSGSGISSVAYEHANSAYLCVGPGGEDYLTYAASTELTAYGGWGHARIGIARSSDLVDWQVPPG
jgi:hypothetical protein